jgi:hypothetical protein
MTGSHPAIEPNTPQIPDDCRPSPRFDGLLVREFPESCLLVGRTQGAVSALGTLAHGFEVRFFEQPPHVVSNWILQQHR